MQCAECQHANRDTAKFCEDCGYRLIHRCTSCDHHVSPQAKFCEVCSTPLSGSTAVLDADRSASQEVESESRFHALVPDVMGMIQREKRVTYRRLQYVFSLSNKLFSDIREELLLRQVIQDEGSKVLVWTGEAVAASPLTSAVTPSQAAPAEPSVIPSTIFTDSISQVASPATEPNGAAITPERPPTGVSPDGSIATSESIRSAPEAERRQLTVMFCDLVGSTDLSGKLDPEDLREVVRAYQETAAQVIGRYEGHIAQYLGDGLLIYFGFPVAHEDDAQRAIYTGLGIPEAMATLNTRLQTDYRVELGVRIGIHTGPVVVGEMGGGGRHENLALGETPNIAARLEGLAQANTAVISPVTAQLVQRAFILEELGLHELKGVADPMMLYTVVRPREAEHDDHEEMLSGGFEALVGRDEEIGLLLRRWEQSKDGQGQVVLISGEAGIGKSSLVEGLQRHVHQEGLPRITIRCSEYIQQSPLFPVIEHLNRVLDWQRHDDVESRLSKLEQALNTSSLPLDETVPLVADLLSLPLPEGRYRALSLSPAQQREQTQDVLVAWMLEEAERQPLMVVWEDLHWADPSTLELLGLFIDQVPTVSMLHVLVYRPTFAPPWPTQSHMTPLMLNRLERPQVEALVTRLSAGKGVPAEVMAHIVSKTDGVPLYVEELTKMLLESTFLQEEADQYTLTGPLAEAAIPATLQDSLMARLDRLPTVREVAQVGSVLGREFAYEMLEALSTVEESTLHSGLSQLVDSELLYQRGRPPRARYTFRHALIRDTAYQSLLRRTRQQYHRQVAQLLEANFPEVIDTQPELVAHHYTEADASEPAIAYWHQAGQRALQHSAYEEAISHLKSGLDLLDTQTDLPERAQRELDFQSALGPALMATKGFGHPEVEHAYARARELCQEVGDTPQLFPVLRGLMVHDQTRGQLQTAFQLGEQLLRLAESQDDPAHLLLAHFQLGNTLFYQGNFSASQTHHSQVLKIYVLQEHQALASRFGYEFCMASHSWLAWGATGYHPTSRRGTAKRLQLAQGHTV